MKKPNSHEGENKKITGISFDLDVFEAMEQRREALRMSRSDFVTRAVLQFLLDDKKIEFRDITDLRKTRRP